MKIWKHGIIGILVIFAFVFAFTACDDGNNTTHTHQWGNWEITTPPTFTSEGEETRICTLDPTHKETRTIAKLQPLDSIDSLTDYLNSLPANTAATPYTIVLNVDDLTGINDTLTGSSKYIDLYLSNSTLTCISMHGFADCPNLVNITIPDSVTEIGVGAFRGCTSLTGVNIPDSVTRILIAAFAGCNKLTSITIPKNMEVIGDVAFNGCTSLTSVTLEGTTNIVDTTGNTFPGDLREKYLAIGGGIGTYTRESGESAIWTKQ